jgi:hypothetical protein
MLKQALGKRAMQPIAVLVNLSVLGGVGDEHAGLRLDAGEAAADRAGRARARHLGGERILAAGIKNDEAELSPG